MRIGLTQRVLYHKGRAYDSIEHGWYSYLKDHTLSFIPNKANDSKSIADELDCLIITGGDDSAIRRRTELNLASEMLKRSKPILGICHGSFLLTSILGGTITEIENHMDTDHTVSYHDEAFPVNSFHTLCIKTPHKSAIVLAVDDQNNCEAWIDGNISGVVWHPERMKTPWMPYEIHRSFFHNKI